MAYNAAKAYGTNKISTASGAELTLMLYDGAVKFCNKAIIALELKNYEETNSNIQKCRNIIVELQTTLDHKYPVASEFDVIYTYIFNLLVQANMKKDEALLHIALEELRGLRELWKQIMNLARGPQLVLDM